MENKKITALVPCRMGSKRVINKNTREFSDKSLVEIKLEQLLKVTQIDKIIVSTDDPKVIELCEKINNPKIELHHRDPYYASSECSNDEFIKYFARELNIEGHLLFTHVTSPFINEKTYTMAIKTYLENLDKYDSLVSVRKIRGYIWDKNKNPLSYNISQGRWPRTQEIEPVYHINSGIFLIDFSLMKELGDRVGNNPLFFECNDIENFDIDWMDDFELGRFLWSISKNKG
jgi:CMP-N-acetylneuraminic acid synthetase